MLPRGMFDAIILIVLGVAVSLLAYRSPKGLPPDWQKWHQQWGEKLKIAGPLLVILGLVLLWWAYRG